MIYNTLRFLDIQYSMPSLQISDDPKFLEANSLHLHPFPIVTKVVTSGRASHYHSRKWTK